MFLRVSASWRKVSNSFIVTRVRESCGGVVKGRRDEEKEEEESVEKSGGGGCI